MTNTIKAIETSYAGCRFRSKLEARWAVFFDALGITWEHEPEGFETSAGRYLPDFRIQIPQTKGHGSYQWFEVKPPNAPTDRRHAALAAETGTPLIVARGLPRNYHDQMQASQYSQRLESPLMIHGVESKPWPVAFCDSTAFWRHELYCSLGDNRHWCMEAMNQTLDTCHLALYGLHEDNGYTTFPPFEGPEIDKAYRAARSERFGT